MGVLSVLGKIAGFVPLPGMNAIGKGLEMAGGVGDALGKQQQGAAQGRVAEAQLGQAQDRNALDRYGQMQGAQDKAAQLDLQRKAYDMSSRSSAGKQALLSMLMSNYKPSQVSVPGVTNATMTGGMGDALKNPQILALLQSVANKGITDQATPNTFTGGNLVDAPNLTALPKQGKGSSILDTIARIAQIGGTIGSSFAKGGD
jgi:hypothetical protein